MSFRQYGGINYAARNNIVKNNYSNANNLSVMTKVGQPSSIINFESDISANIIYSDLTVNNLTVKYNTTLKGPLDVSGNTTLRGDLTVTSNNPDNSSNSGIVYITNNINNPTATLRIVASSFHTANFIQSGETSSAGSAADLRFTSMNAYQEWMVITKEGKVGIGTLTPAKILDVNGDALINGLTIGRGTNNVLSNTAIGYQALLNNDGGYSNTAIGYQALLNNDGGYSNTAIGYQALLKNEGYYTSEIDFGGLANTAIGDQALTNNIKGSYNIALGTGALLLTNSTGNIGIGINTLLYNDTGSYNVAIGTEAGTSYPPPNQSEPVGPKDCVQCTFIGAYSGNLTVGKFTSSTAIGSESQITADHQITLGTSLETVYIPGTLTVIKDALINGLTVGKGSANLSGNTAVGVNALKSNVHGINNTAIGDSALYLDVSGNYNTALGFEALYNNLYSEGNTALGLKALRNNISGLNNVAIGLRALYCFQSNDTYANGSGNYNVAVGNFSLYSNQSASYNTAVGNSALYSNTTGTLNTAVGNEALRSNTTGGYNTAVGNNAMYSYNETAYAVGNTAIGNDAMYSNVSGLYCTAVGYQASYHQTGYSNTSLGFRALFGSNGISSGANNCAFGDSALTLNTTGYNNIAIGYHSLEKNTTTGENTAIGHLSLQNTTSEWNTAVGSHSLQNNANGFYNTAVGGQSLQSNVSGSNNTAVGLNAGFTINGSNDTAIGSQTLQYNSSGNNTAIGAYALQFSYSGSNNTAIGVNAGYNGTSTVNYCTFLGSETGATVSGLSASTAIGYGSRTTANNQIMMGRSTETVYIPGGLNLNVYPSLISGSVTLISLNNTLPQFVTFNGDIVNTITVPKPDDVNKGASITFRRNTGNDHTTDVISSGGGDDFYPYNDFVLTDKIRITGIGNNERYTVFTCTMISDGDYWYVISWFQREN